MLKKERERRIL